MVGTLWKAVTKKETWVIKRRERRGKEERREEGKSEVTRLKGQKKEEERERAVR